MLNFKLNGRDMSVDAPADTALLTVLVNDLGLNGAKYGCGLSQCGACTILIDGDPVLSCQTAARSAVGRSITTLEGLLVDGNPAPLQQAFIDEPAAQCGYCIPGMARPPGRHPCRIAPPRFSRQRPRCARFSTAWQLPSLAS